MKTPLDLLNDALLEACAKREQVRLDLSELEPLQAELRRLDEAIASTERAVAHLEGGDSSWRKSRAARQRQAQRKAERGAETPEEKVARLHKKALQATSTPIGRQVYAFLLDHGPCTLQRLWATENLAEATVRSLATWMKKLGHISHEGTEALEVSGRTFGARRWLRNLTPAGREAAIAFAEEDERKP